MLIFIHGLLGEHTGYHYLKMNITLSQGSGQLIITKNLCSVSLKILYGDTFLNEQLLWQMWTINANLSVCVCV